MSNFVVQVASTWEIVVSIFKGFNKQLSHKILSSYKDAIVSAINHSSPEITSLAQSIFEIKDSLDDSAKRILNEIEKSKSCSKSDNVTKKKVETSQTKEARVVGSFLNRKSSNGKTVFKPPEKNDKNTLVQPEPDSQVNNVYYSRVPCMFSLYLSSYRISFISFISLFVGLRIHKNRSEIRR